MGEQAQTAGVEWLTALLTMQGINAPVTASLVEDEAGYSCWLTIAEESLSPEQITVLIGEGVPS